MRRPRLAVMAGVGAVVVLAGAVLALVLRPLHDMRADLEAQRHLTTELLDITSKQLDIVRDQRRLIREQLKISREGVAVAKDARDIAGDARDIARDTLGVARDARDIAASTESTVTRGVELAERLSALTEDLLRVARDINSKFPDNPSGRLPPP